MRFAALCYNAVAFWWLCPPVYPSFSSTILAFSPPFPVLKLTGIWSFSAVQFFGAEGRGFWPSRPLWALRRLLQPGRFRSFRGKHDFRLASFLLSLSMLSGSPGTSCPLEPQAPRESPGHEESPCLLKLPVPRKPPASRKPLGLRTRREPPISWTTPDPAGRQRRPDQEELRAPLEACLRLASRPSCSCRFFWSEWAHGTFSFCPAFRHPPRPPACLRSTRLLRTPAPLPARPPPRLRRIPLSLPLRMSMPASSPPTGPLPMPPTRLDRILPPLRQRKPGRLRSPGIFRSGRMAPCRTSQPVAGLSSRLPRLPRRPPRSRRSRGRRGTRERRRLRSLQPARVALRHFPPPVF